MRKIYLAAVVLCAAGLFGAFAVPAEGLAGARIEVRLAPVGAAFAPPRLGKNQGWLTVVNRDWKPYTIHVVRKGRMSLSEGVLPGGTVIRSGNSVTMAVDRDIWEILGSSGDALKCRVREGGASTISLEPFGFAGSTGLRGVSNDGTRVREKVLINSYVPPPVVVQAPPVVIHRPPPVVVHTPPPVIINRPHQPSHQPPRRPEVPDRRPSGGRPDQNRPDRDRPGQDRDRDRGDRDQGRDCGDDRGFSFDFKSR